MPSWRKSVKPYAAVWAAVLEHAQGRGLVHGQLAVSMLLAEAQGRYAAHPSDGADLLAAMVEDGELVPCKLDLAGTDRSVRAFRMLDGAYQQHGGASGTTWARCDAHMWTYTAAKPALAEVPAEVGQAELFADEK